MDLRVYYLMSDGLVLDGTAVSGPELCFLECVLSTTCPTVHAASLHSAWQYFRGTGAPLPLEHLLLDNPPEPDHIPSSLFAQL